MPGGQTGNARSGSWLVNSSSNGPVLEFKATNNDFTTTPRYTDHRLNIWHEGTSSPAVVYDDYRGVRLKPVIDCNGAGQDAIEYRNDSFLHIIFGGILRRFTQYGINEDAAGGARALLNTSIVGGAATADININNAWIIFGGQLGGSDVTTAAEIRSENTWISGTRIEGPSVGLHFGPGTTRAISNKVIGPYFASIDEHPIYFDNSRGTTVTQPRRLPNGLNTIEAVRWSGDSQRDGLIGDYTTINKNWRDDGASRNYVKFIGQLSDGFIGAIDTTVPVFVGAATDHNYAPAFHDGTSWRFADSTTFTP